MMVEAILVPTDGSEHADRAVRFAADLAQKYKARLVALHVTSPSLSERVPKGLGDFARAEHIEASEREILESIGNQILQAAETRAREQGIDSIETLLEVGDAAATVLSVAKSQNIDLIVMGSRGLGDLKGLLLGSVSQKVCAHSACTCITVK